MKLFSQQARESPSVTEADPQFCAMLGRSWSGDADPVLASDSESVFHGKSAPNATVLGLALGALGAV